VDLGLRQGHGATQDIPAAVSVNATGNEDSGVEHLPALADLFVD